VSSALYGILWILARTIGWLCFHYRVVGTVPRTGGFIVAANHASYLDIPLLGCGMRRRAWYLGRSDLFPVPGVNQILQWLGWIPLRTGRLDRDAFSKAVRLIKAGKVVVIFPEGRRTLDGQLQSPKSGIGVIVAQTGCPVVPAYLKGTYQVLPTGAKWPRFRPVTVLYGDSLMFSRSGESSESKQFYHEVSRIVMDRIAFLGAVQSSTQQPSADIRKAE
jgi:1-acyl-sn-glycerol-3-phosphate acyltransferase